MNNKEALGNYFSSVEEMNKRCLDVARAYAEFHDEALNDGIIEFIIESTSHILEIHFSLIYGSDKDFHFSNEDMTIPVEDFIKYEGNYLEYFKRQREIDLEDWVPRQMEMIKRQMRIQPELKTALIDLLKKDM